MELNRIKEAADRFRIRLEPYLSHRLSPIQSRYMIRVRRIFVYPEADNPFAVRWRKVRKDAMEIGKLFEECMYLLDHDIRDMETLERMEKEAGRKERNLIRRIRERNEAAREDVIPGLNPEQKEMR